jgi:hypothetical protein
MKDALNKMNNSVESLENEENILFTSPDIKVDRLNFIHNTITSNIKSKKQINFSNDLIGNNIINRTDNIIKELSNLYLTKNINGNFNKINTGFKPSKKIISKLPSLNLNNNNLILVNKSNKNIIKIKKQENESLNSNIYLNTEGALKSTKRIKIDGKNLNPSFLKIKDKLKDLYLKSIVPSKIIFKSRIKTEE